ncbi:hypothetical protein B0H34DRAFT_806682 [Crassisporium funariophilum]|nr:hypothetical protein B0H34DRAFT_806682 [Crassisporium funariophilum]
MATAHLERRMNKYAIIIYVQDLCTADRTLDIGRVGDEDEKELEMRMRAALRDVALEHEEVLILKVSQITFEGDSSQSMHYQPPSWQKKHAEYLHNDTELIQKETERLKARLAQTKKASSKLRQSIKTLQRAVEDAGSRSREAEERLSELSITADSGVMSTLGDAQDLESLRFGQESPVDPSMAHEPKDPSPSEEPTIQSARTRLADAQKGLLGLISRLREPGERFAQIRKEEVYKREDVQFEAGRLQREDISSGAKGGGLLVDLLRELEEPEESEDEDEKMKMKTRAHATLSRAWDMDQLFLLSTHQTALNEALVDLDAVLNPLEALHAGLARVVQCLREVEALLEVFGEELEGIDLKIPYASQEGSVTDGEGGERGDDDRSSKSWSKIEASEKAWLQTLITKYSLRPLHPALPLMYAHSPLRTSPPFA